MQLPAGDDESAILDHAHRRRLDLTTMRDFWVRPDSGPPTLLLGYGQIPEHAVPTAVRELADGPSRTRHCRLTKPLLVSGRVQDQTGAASGSRRRS